MSFEEFARSKRRRSWVHEEGLRLYVRRSALPGRGDFELASVSAWPRSRGHLTAFLDRWELACSFFVENATPRFGKYLIRRGYKPHPEHRNCYLKEKTRCPPD